MLPTKFGVSWPFGSAEEAKNRFLRWQPLQPLWISDQNDFSYFDLLVIPMLPIKFQENWPFVSGEEPKNRFSRWGPSFMSTGLSVQEKKQKTDFKHGHHLGFPI